MSFLNLSLPMVLAGLGGLAALLFVLQQLRVRYREIKVPTAMFWQQASEEAPVRIFRKRFRHLMSYLLTVLIAGLLWLGFAGPEVNEDTESGTYHILYLDGSAAMLEGDLFDQALQALLADLSQYPANAREVVWGGYSTTKLLDAGEHELLLEKRLDSRRPAKIGSQLVDYVALKSRTGRSARQTEIHVYGLATIPEDARLALPQDISISSATDLVQAAENLGIVSIGAVPSIAGPAQVDVLLGLGARGTDVQASDVSISLDGKAVSLDRLEEVSEGNYLLRGVPAAGGALEVQMLTEDVLQVDNRASLKLPDRSPVTVSMSSAMPAELLEVIEADEGLRLVKTGESAEVTVGADSSAMLQLVPTDGQANAFHFFMIEPEGDVTESLQATVKSFGLGLIDHTALATQMEKPIGIGIGEGPERRIQLWQELMQPGFNFTESEAFPIFVSRSIRWLAGRETVSPFSAAGEPIVTGSRLEGLGDSFHQEILGARDYADQGSALLDPTVTSHIAGLPMSSNAGSLPPVQENWDWLALVLMSLLLIVFVEWYLHQRGQMP